jgi:hypothetical protein
MLGEFWKESIGDMETIRGNLGSAFDKGILKEEDLSKYQYERLKLLIKGIDDIYESFHKVNEKKRLAVNTLLNALGDNQVVIFCCTIYGKFCHELLEYKSQGIVKAYCDNNSDLWNTTIYEVEVLSPTQAVKTYPDAVYIVANLNSANIIKQQLENLGISKDRICGFVENPDWLLFNCID